MPEINRQIATRAQVDALTNEPEGETVDYKSDAEPGHLWELAKDIAAFANHLGGVVVIGAVEQKKQRGVASLAGLMPAKIRRLRTAYENAAKDYCSPSPIVTFEVIPLDDGKEVLAVNVRAYATGFVASRFYVVDDAGEKVAAENAWQFFVRIGTHNAPLTLEQATLYMSTSSRRVAILLANVPVAGPLRVVFRKPPDGGKKTLLVSDVVNFRGVSIDRNVALITFGAEDDMYQPEQALPLDDITSVWSAEDGIWALRVNGYFDNWSGLRGERTTEYIPYSG